MQTVHSLRCLRAVYGTHSWAKNSTKPVHHLGPTWILFWSFTCHRTVVDSVHRKGTSCLCMFYEIPWNIFLLWLLLLVKHRKCQYRWKMAQMLPYQSLFFLSKLLTSSSTLAVGVMTCHTGCNLLDILSRSASSDYALNLPFNFYGRFSTLKIYLQSFFNINSLLNKMQKNLAVFWFILAILWKLNEIMKIQVIFGPRSGKSPFLYYKNDRLLLISNERLMQALARQASWHVSAVEKAWLPLLLTNYCWCKPPQCILKYPYTLWNIPYLSNLYCRNEQE